MYTAVFEGILAVEQLDGVKIDHPFCADLWNSRSYVISKAHYDLYEVQRIGALPNLIDDDFIFHLSKLHVTLHTARSAPCKQDIVGSPTLLRPASELFDKIMTYFV